MSKIKENLMMLKDLSEKIKTYIKNSPQVKRLENELIWFMDESQKLNLQTEKNILQISYD